MTVRWYNEHIVYCVCRYIERWRHAVHAALGLVVLGAGSGRAFACLTPQRIRGIMLFEHSGAPDLDLYALSDGLHCVLRGLLDGQGARVFNRAMALPPLTPTAEDWAGVPIFARVADQGDPRSRHGDVAARVRTAATQHRNRCYRCLHVLLHMVYNT